MAEPKCAVPQDAKGVDIILKKIENINQLSREIREKSVNISADSHDGDVCCDQKEPFSFNERLNNELDDLTSILETAHYNLSRFI